MLAWCKKHWPELLAFGTILGVYLMDCAPSWTWINTNSDGVHLTYAAKYLYPAHKGSAPLYLLLGHLFVQIPLGTEFWRMALISVIGSFVGAIFVYLIIKEHLKWNDKARWFALVGTLVFAGSALVLSQTIIVKYYTLCTAFGLLAYYLALKKHYNWSMVALGAGFATHPIIVLMAVPIVLFNKEMRNWKRLLLLAPFTLFYLYVPLVTKFNPSPNMWNNLTPGSQITDFTSTLFMLTGGLAIWDFPKRIFDTIGILGVSLGLALIPIVVYFARNKKWLKSQLFWLFILPIGYFATDLSPQCFPKGTLISTKKLIRGKNNSHFFAPMQKPIEAIQIGDEVLSFNEQTGVKEYKKVSQLFTKLTDKTILLKLSNGNELRCTPNHPIAVNWYGKIIWTEAGNLAVGDELIQYKYRGIGYRIASIMARGKTPEERYGDGAKSFRDKCRVNALRQWADPLNGINSKEHHRKVSDGNKRAWLNPLSGHNSENRKRLRSEYMKRRWSDAVTARRMMQNRHKTPNKAELELQSIINSVSPDFKYNGNADSGVVIGSKIPDFVNMNGKKKLIELYGTYWHKDEQTQSLINHYARYGFGCLVIWEHELNDKEKVKQKIKDFTFNPNTAVVTIASMREVYKQEPVYNIGVEDNNNYFAFGILVHNCYVYMYPAIAFGAIIAAIGLSKMDKRWLYAVGVVALLLMAYNANYFDIGRTLDPHLAATEYMQELNAIPNGNIVIATQGWEWTAIYVYNKENNRQIIPVYAGTLQSGDYQKQLFDNWGVVSTGYSVPGNLIHSQQLIVNSIIAQNKNVWITNPTSDYKNYGTEIIPATPVDYGSGIIIPTWQFKPNNPYDFITGAIEVKQWVYIDYSNYTIALFFLLGASGYLVVMVVSKSFKRRPKDVARKI